MKNKLLIGIIVVIVLIIGFAVVFSNIAKNSQDSVTVSPGLVKNGFVQIDACDILTKDIAQQTLGETVTPNEQASGAATSSELSVSTCSYRSPVKGEDDTTGGVVMLLARIAVNDTGAEHNKQQFISTKPQEATDINGLGDNAFYSSKFNQLNVLVGGNWYIVTRYKTTATKGTLEATKTLAEKLNFQ